MIIRKDLSAESKGRVPDPHLPMDESHPVHAWNPSRAPRPVNQVEILKFLKIVVLIFGKGKVLLKIGRVPRRFIKIHELPQGGDQGPVKVMTVNACYMPADGAFLPHGRHIVLIVRHDLF